MLKTVSSITNAIGALNYKGTWNASTNSPALASGVGTKGDYYVVSVAGSTNLDGETLWGVGDWAVYNGAAWQKVEGGNTINATTVSASTSVTTPVIQATSSAGGTLKNNGGTAQLQWGSGGGSNLSLEVATNINPADAAVAISPTGTGTVTINPSTASTMNNVAIGGTTPLAGSFTTVKAATTVGVGAATPSASGAGITFPATQSASTDVNTLDDYEEGTWTPALLFDGGMSGSFTYTTQTGSYTKIGRLVTARFNLAWSAIPAAGTIMVMTLPFTAVNAGNTAGFISGQGGITCTGTYTIVAGDGLTISGYIPAQCSICAVKSGGAFADPLQKSALTSASGSLAGVIIYEV
jgi:hypothetical protein